MVTRKERTMYNDEKIILTDIDGVVLNWAYAFHVWMSEQGQVIKKEHCYDISETYGLSYPEGKFLVRMFNESSSMGFLPPLRDAMHYMKKLHEEHGYVFHAITSQSNQLNAQKLRIMNLEKLFGETLFEKFIILGCGDDKDEALEPYRGSGYIWVEDKVKNAELGVELGLDSILMEHSFNMHHETIKLAKNWKDIYEYITGI